MAKVSIADLDLKGKRVLVSLACGPMDLEFIRAVGHEFR